MSRRIYEKDIICGVLIGIWIFVSHILGMQADEPSLTALIKQAGGGFFSFYTYEVVLLIYKLSPFFAIEIIYGIRISRHFSSTGMYYLSRCENRTRWFYRELKSLALHCFAVITTYSGALIFLFAIQNGRCEITFSGVYLCICYWLLLSLYFLFAVLLINILSLKAGSIAGSLTVLCGQMLLLLALVLIPESEVHRLSVKAFIAINPMTNIILGLHSSSFSEINSCINQYGLNWDLNCSVLYFCLLICLTSLVGANVCRQYEFL